MKRKASPSKQTSSSKKAKVEVPDYHETPSIREADGSTQWPAPQFQMDQARDFIKRAVESNEKVLIVPDKDADVLSSGAILRHTLSLLGLAYEKIDVHVLSKGNSIHT